MFWSEDSAGVVQGSRHARYELSLDRPTWPVIEPPAATLPDGLVADRRKHSRKTIVLATPRRQRRLRRLGG